MSDTITSSCIASALNALDEAMNAVTSLKSKRQIAALKTDLQLRAENLNLNYGEFYE